MFLAELLEDAEHQLPRVLPGLAILRTFEEDLQRALVVAGAERLGDSRILDRFRDRRLRDLVEECLDARRRLRADELRDDVPVPERLDRRDPADAVLARDTLVRVHVDLRERDALRLRLLLEDRRERLARSAPV